MDTLFVSFDDVRLLEALNRSEVIAFPTETVYGLGVRYDSSKAFDKLVEVKKRPPLKPFTLMGGDNFNILDYAYLNKAQLKLFKHFSPGPVTFLVRPKENLPKQGRDASIIRSPFLRLSFSNPVCRYCSGSLKLFL